MMARIGVAELVRAGIDALSHADAEQLEVLAAEARGPSLPETTQEQKLAQERLRALGHLIALTRRNLRLLRGQDGYRSFGNCREKGSEH